MEKGDASASAELPSGRIQPLEKRTLPSRGVKPTEPAPKKNRGTRGDPTERQRIRSIGASGKGHVYGDADGGEKVVVIEWIAVEVQR